jgi:hypothetical protein
MRQRCIVVACRDDPVRLGEGDEHRAVAHVVGGELSAPRVHEPKFGSWVAS